MRLLSGVCAAALAAAAAASNDGYTEEDWAFGDWRAETVAYDTGEDWRIECAARTGGDGLPTLRIEIANADAGPPHAWPEISLREGALRGHDTVMQQDDTVRLVFDNDHFVDALVERWIDEEGFARAAARVHPDDAQFALRAMRVAHGVDFIHKASLLHTASLTGFTASYGKIAEACGFSTEGVIE